MGLFCLLDPPPDSTAPVSVAAPPKHDTAHPAPTPSTHDTAHPASTPPTHDTAHPTPQNDASPVHTVPVKPSPVVHPAASDSHAVPPPESYQATARQHSAPSSTISNTPSLSDAAVMVSDTTSSDSLSSVENEYAFLLRPSDSTLPQPTDVLISPIDSLFLSYAAAADSNNGIVLPFSAADTVAYRKSLFTGHYLQPSHADYQHRTPPQQDGWIGFCVVVIAFILCIYYRFHRLSLQEIFVAVFSNHVFNIVQRENNLLRSMSLMPSLLVYAATMAVFALSLQHPVHPAPIVIVLQLFLIMAALLILRNGGISYFGSVFANSEATQRYIHQGYLQQLIVATIMLPIMLAGIYLPISSTVYTIVAFIPLTFFFFTNLLRCVQIIFSYPKDTNLFLIYYLCILEIAPILIAIKIGISL